jgi:Secretion system C-terminal sorting domain
VGVKLIDLSGKLIMQGKINANSNLKISKENYSKGLYLLHINSNNKSETHIVNIL